MKRFYGAVNFSPMIVRRKMRNPPLLGSVHQEDEADAYESSSVSSFSTGACSVDGDGGAEPPAGRAGGLSDGVDSCEGDSGCLIEPSGAELPREDDPPEGVVGPLCW